MIRVVHGKACGEYPDRKRKRVMNKVIIAVAIASGVFQTAFAAIPPDGRVYDEYLKTAPGKERKAFLREAFGGGQFDMRDIFELVEQTKENEWNVKKAAKLDKLIRRGLGRAGGAGPARGQRTAPASGTGSAAASCAAALDVYLRLPGIEWRA